MSIADPVPIVLLVVALVCLLGAAWIGRELRRFRADQWERELDMSRTRALSGEHRRVAKAAVAVADTAQATTETVVVATGVVETAHMAIAAIPFAVLDAIPATRRSSRIVRGVHDEIAGTVYRTIGQTSRSVGDMFGRRRPPADRPRPVPGRPAPSRPEPEHPEPERPEPGRS